MVNSLPKSGQILAQVSKKHTSGAEARFQLIGSDTGDKSPAYRPGELLRELWSCGLSKPIC
jgi:hypothetical protein